MKNRGLILLLATGFLSCSTVSNLTQMQYHAPQKIILDVSHKDRVSLLEDTDGDGIFDTSFDYDETNGKPDYILGNSNYFYLLELKGVEILVPISPPDKSQIPAPIIPEYKGSPFTNNLRLYAKLNY